MKSNSQIRPNATTLFTPCFYKRRRNRDKKSMPKQWRLKLDAMQQLCPLLFSLLLLSSLPFAFLWPSLTFFEFQALAEGSLWVTSRHMMMMSNLRVIVFDLTNQSFQRLVKCKKKKVVSLDASCNIFIHVAVQRCQQRWTIHLY